MKMEYESPIMEIFSFKPSDAIMDSSCPTFTCPDQNCSLDIGCIVDGMFPNLSNI